MSSLEAALDQLRIPELWRILGLRGDRAERDKTVTVRSPFRDDEHPSFSIFNKGRNWRDHGTGEGGNAIDFLAKPRNLSNKEACRELMRLAGTAHRAGGSHSNNHRRDDEKDKAAAARRAKWPQFRAPSPLGIETVAKLRGLSVEGVSLAAERGLLFTAAKTDHGPAWVITDSRRLNAQARRFDGRHWAHIEDKAWTLPGSIGATPIGLNEARDFEKIIFVEGGPDLLAAFHLIWCSNGERDFGVVAMLGSAPRIPEGELAAFKGKRVRIFAHLDGAGLKAEGRWWRQLKEAGAIVDSFDFGELVRSDGQPVDDLNDFCLVHVDQWEAERETIEEAFDF